MGSPWNWVSAQGVKNQSSWATRGPRTLNDIFIHLDAILQCDRRTDILRRQRPRDMLCVAWVKTTTDTCWNRKVLNAYLWLLWWVMTKSDIALQNSNRSPNPGSGSPNRGSGSHDGGARSGIRRDPATFNSC